MAERGLVLISDEIYEGVRCFPREVARVIADYTFRELPACGFEFSSKHLPYAYQVHQLYLEWLVSISYRLKYDYAQYHNHIYDPMVDTTAVVESYILVTLGRLEMADKFFNRRELFQGAQQFADYMHPFIRQYAFNPPARVWFSPLSARYLDDAKGIEAVAIGNLRTLIGHICACANLKSGAILPPGKDSCVMAIVEDTLLALLARLQHLENRVVNTARVCHQLVEELLTTDQQRYLKKEVRNYLETFPLGHETDSLLTFHNRKPFVFPFYQTITN